ncbi:Acyl-CoA dehydrogenase [Burkholderiales bacterium]|nr:Acyl-CoA dehydrogenase [Burkholderiales bacterium]
MSIALDGALVHPAVARARLEAETAWSCPPALVEATASIAVVRRLVADQLSAKAIDVDLNSEYPEEFLRALGRAGGFQGAAATEFGGNGLSLQHVVRVMEEVAKVCLSTGFLVWCQTACARYVQMSDNEALKRRLLARIVGGDILAGTGLSNTIKSCDTIEEFRLSARRVDGGYVVSGALPWVSNLGPTHYFATGCPVVGQPATEDGLVFVLVDCQSPNFRLVESARFVALDGTRTVACQFKETFVPDAMVLAHPGQSRAYFQRIKPGMILAQMGMGLGLIDACVEMMRQSNKTHAHVNQYLDDQVDDVDAVLQQTRAATYALCEALDHQSGAVPIVDILKVRLAGGEHSLLAANAAMLHVGAKGYQKRSAAQRRLREAYFIAIVTPATKHLRREIARLAAGNGHGIGV